MGDYCAAVLMVLDNGVWDTGDGKEPTATAFGLDFVALALANGWDKAHVRPFPLPVPVWR